MNEITNLVDSSTEIVDIFKNYKKNSISTIYFNKLEDKVYFLGFNGEVMGMLNTEDALMIQRIGERIKRRMILF